MEQGLAIVVQISTGIALAACAGLRTFLPLLAAGIAGRAGWLELARPFEWLASWPALVVFGVAVIVEILSDKIPLVDHVLDFIGGVVKPAAGAVLATSVLTDLPPLHSAVVGILAGGASAGLVHLAKAKVRLFSTATTAGLASPVLSLGEDLASLIGSVVAIAIPLLLIALVLGTFLVLLVARRRLRLRAARLER